MWRALTLSALMLAAAPHVAPAQDREQTLADIRQELSVLYVELQRLRNELNTTGAPQGVAQGGGTLARVDAIEAELRRLTSLTEALQIRVDRVVIDGTNRVGDLEFRLCELEAECDLADLGETPMLGGETDLPPSAAAPLPATNGGTGGPALAVSEQSDFDRARAAYDAGSFAEAEELFGAFTETYPGGPLSAEAHFLRGQSAAQQGAWSRAARAYLDSFSGSPDSPRAPEALLNLGTSLGQLGQTDEACLTLGEVEVRYPTSGAVAEARAAMSTLGCS